MASNTCTIDCEHCSSIIIEYIFNVTYRPKTKYNLPDEITTLTCLLCEYHYAKICFQNGGEKPRLFGRDYYDALDGLTLDDEFNCCSANIEKN